MTPPSDMPSQLDSHPAAPGTTTGEPADGRTARSQRTREAVVESMLALIREGSARPTAREIAARAGISLRSVYVHFDDLDDLFLAAASAQMALVAPLLTPVAPSGPVADRVAAVCAQRAAVYREIGPVRRAAELQAPLSTTLARLLDQARDATRADLARAFAPELDALGPAERRRALARAEAAAGPEAWDALRRTLDDDETEDAMRDLLLAALVRARSLR